MSLVDVLWVSVWRLVPFRRCNWLHSRGMSVGILYHICSWGGGNALGCSWCWCGIWHERRHPSSWLCEIWVPPSLRYREGSCDSWPCHCPCSEGVVWSSFSPEPVSILPRLVPSSRVSRSLSGGSEMMVSALCVSVLMPPALCSISWWLWNCRYWSVRVCRLFLHAQLEDAAVLLVGGVSSMGGFPSVSSSLVHWMLVYWVFRCCVNGSMFAVFITARASSTYRPNICVSPGMRPTLYPHNPP